MIIYDLMNRNLNLELLISDIGNIKCELKKMRKALEQGFINLREIIADSGLHIELYLDDIEKILIDYEEDLKEPPDNSSEIEYYI